MADMLEIMFGITSQDVDDALAEAERSRVAAVVARSIASGSQLFLENRPPAPIIRPGHCPHNRMEGRCVVRLSPCHVGFREGAARHNAAPRVHQSVRVPLRCVPCSRARQRVRRAPEGVAPAWKAHLCWEDLDGGVWRRGRRERSRLTHGCQRQGLHWRHSACSVEQVVGRGHAASHLQGWRRTHAGKVGTAAVGQDRHRGSGVRAEGARRAAMQRFTACITGPPATSSRRGCRRDAHLIQMGAYVSSVRTRESTFRVP